MHKMYFYFSDLKGCKIIFSTNTSEKNPPSSKQTELGETHTSALLLQIQDLKGCVGGQTRVCHEASFPNEGNKTPPRPLCLAQLISCHSSLTGKCRGKQR